MKRIAGMILVVAMVASRDKGTQPFVVCDG